MKSAARTKRQANKIWEIIKDRKAEFPKPLPCPCCGSEDLYVGHHSCMNLGVECNDCGLQLGREYPEKLTQKMAKEMDNSFEEGRYTDCDRLCIYIAIEDWNKRP